MRFSRGGKKGIWSSNRYTSDERLVITEAVIDALCYHALFGNQKTRYASTSGAWSQTTKEMIWVAQKALPVVNGAVILAYDNDASGDKYRRATHQMLASSGKQVIDHIPRKKDFNADLCENLPKRNIHFFVSYCPIFSKQLELSFSIIEFLEVSDVAETKDH